MFDTLDIRTLRSTLDCIPVAMFAAERPYPDDAFRMLCINRQYEDETRLANVDVAGLRPMDMLPPREGEAVESRYAFCCRNQKVISFTETLNLEGVETRWHTILYPLTLAGGRQRVIGSAFALSPDGRFPAAMPFIDTAMEGLRRSAPTPIALSQFQPNYKGPAPRPAAQVVSLAQRAANRSQSFREQPALFLHRHDVMGAPGSTTG